MDDLLISLSPHNLQNTSFHRYIRDADGNPTEKMIFNVGEIVQVPAELVAVIANDIGKTLYICTRDKNDIPRVDSDATKEFCARRDRGELTPGRKKPPKAKRKPQPAKDTVSESQQTDGDAD